MDWTCP